MRLAVFFFALLLAAPAQAVVFTVNSTVDAVDAIPGDGVCADASGACTLRAAIQEANALAGADVVDVGCKTIGDVHVSRYVRRIRLIVRNPR